MKKCKNCNQLSVREFNGIAQSKWCVPCRKIKTEEKKAKKKLTKGYLKREYRLLHEKAWKAWSKYIRTKYANLDGFVECYTCPAVKHYKEMDAGHFHHNKLDFDERNIHPQCDSCNRRHSGRREIYATNLLSDGVDLQQLLLDSNTISYSKDDLEEIIRKYSP